MNTFNNNLYFLLCKLNILNYSKLNIFCSKSASLKPSSARPFYQASVSTSAADNNKIHFDSLLFVNSVVPPSSLSLFLVRSCRHILCVLVEVDCVTVHL